MSFPPLPPPNLSLMRPEEKPGLVDRAMRAVMYGSLALLVALYALMVIKGCIG